MRFVILRDTKIGDAEYKKLEDEFSSFIKENTGLTPTFFIEQRDFSSVPTEPDSDGDLKPSAPYMKALMASVHAKYGDYGADSVVMLVHRENWVFQGIWGTNFSNLYYKYHVHLCRFDHRNVANSLGTLYHEWMHSLDVLIKTHTGFDVTTLFGVPYDKFIVHGGRPGEEGTTVWQYIKWKDNTVALKLMAPHLRQAYQVRKDLYYAPLTNLQKWFIGWLRSLLNQKDGVSPSINAK